MLIVSDITALPETPGEQNGLIPLLALLSGNQPVVHLKRALCFLTCPVAALLVCWLSPGPFQLAQRTFILPSPDLAQAVRLSSRPYRVSLRDSECLMSTTVPKFFSLKYTLLHKINCCTKTLWVINPHTQTSIFMYPIHTQLKFTFVKVRKFGRRKIKGRRKQNKMKPRA